jgi:hypothetical protein
MSAVFKEPVRENNPVTIETKLCLNIINIGTLRCEEPTTFYILNVRKTELIVG